MPPDQMLILRLARYQQSYHDNARRDLERATYGCSWKKNTSCTNIKPPYIGGISACIPHRGVEECSPLGQR